LDSGTCFKVRLQKCEKVRKLCTILSVSRGGADEFDDGVDVQDDKFSGNPVYKSKAVNEYTREELRVIVRSLKLIPNERPKKYFGHSKKALADTLSEYLHAHDDILTVYDGTETHEVSPSDCRIISHVYEEMVYTAVHELGKSAAGMSSADINSLALEMYAQQARIATNELGEVVLQELEVATNANTSAAWTSEEVNLFCSAYLRHGDDLNAIKHILSRGKVNTRCRSMKEIVDFFHRNFPDDNRVSVKGVQDVYRVAMDGLVDENETDEDDEDDYQDGGVGEGGEEEESQNTLEMDNQDNEAVSNTSMSELDFDRAWKVLNTAQKISNKDELCNTIDNLGITEAYELEYCNGEQLLALASCLKDIPKLVFKVAVKLESKRDILEANGHYRRSTRS
jgi:hypothetical protein